MGQSIGTRSQQGLTRERPDQGHETRTHTRDKGMSKNVTTSLTFTASTARIAGSNGDFAAFGLNDPLLVGGVNLNNGEFTVTGLDATNQAYLTVDPPPKDEGPIAGTVRTI